MNTNDIVAYEEGELEEALVIKMFQDLINSGQCWTLQGSYGRTAMALIEAGQCVLGEVGHKDYWGNYVPSRTEVEPGSKGSVEYAERMKSNQ